MKDNKLLRIVLTALSAIFLLPLLGISANAAGKLEVFALEGKMGPADELTYTIEWWQPHVPEEYKYSISIPYDMIGEDVTVQLIGVDMIVLDGKSVHDGDVISVPTKGAHKIICNNVTYTLQVFHCADIPAIYIDTVSGSLEDVYADKSHKEEGVITIIDTENVYYAGNLDYIKGRGNSTWLYDKRPFNIKLEDKTDLFGMGKHKNWTLLANYRDVTSIKSKVALDFATTVGAEFTSKSVMADLFINNEYMGLYTLTEKVEVGENRVEITSLEDLNEDVNPDIDIEECEQGGSYAEGSGNEFGSYKYVNIPENPEDITGGYLLESELRHRYDDEVSGFVSDYGQCMVVKSPEYASKEQVEYIKGYYQEFEDAVRSDDGYNSKGKHYSDYLDVKSMARIAVFSEFMKNVDAGRTSFYLYKEAGGKFVASPVWDYDMALGLKATSFDIEMADPYGYYASNLKVDKDDIYTIISLLNQHIEFRELSAQIWEEVFAPLKTDLDNSIVILTEEIYDSAVTNKNKWTDDHIRPVADVTQWYNNEVSYVRHFLEHRGYFMDDAFSTDNLYVSYKSNEGNGEMLDVNHYKVGTSAVVMENEFVKGDKAFLGWNTQPDGSGVQYASGDEIVMEESIVLYAQWEQPTFFEMIEEFFKSLFNLNNL